MLGFGATGSVLGTALAARGCAVRAHDAQLDLPATHASMQQRIEQAGVHPAALADALRGAKLVICTAGLAAVSEATRLLGQGQIFLDLRDLPPAAKLAQADAVTARGADYVDAAWPSSAANLHLAMPMHLGGVRAAELAPALNALGFHTRAVSDSPGIPRASVSGEMDPGHPPPAEAPRPPHHRGELP